MKSLQDAVPINEVGIQSCQSFFSLFIKKKKGMKNTFMRFRYKTFITYELCAKEEKGNEELGCVRLVRCSLMKLNVTIL
jgi:hypothetical protein